MKKCGKIAAVLLTVVLCLSELGAAFLVAGHTHHDCTGESCTVCDVLAQCDQRIRAVPVAAAAVLLLLFFAQYALSLTAAVPSETSGKTPVNLKVKLLN